MYTISPFVVRWDCGSAAAAKAPPKALRQICWVRDRNLFDRLGEVASIIGDEALPARPPHTRPRCSAAAVTAGSSTASACTRSTANEPRARSKSVTWIQLDSRVDHQRRPATSGCRPNSPRAQSCVTRRRPVATSRSRRRRPTRSPFRSVRPHAHRPSPDRGRHPGQRRHPISRHMTLSFCRWRDSGGRSRGRLLNGDSSQFPRAAAPLGNLPDLPYTCTYWR